MSNSEIIFIQNNLHLTNLNIAQYLNKTEAQIRSFLYKRMIKRSPSDLQAIRDRIGSERTGEKNPNWKNGISKNNYHYKKIQIERYPDRIKARQRVYYHKRAGNIEPGKCSVCGSVENITAHHPDYSKPLDVVWLCRDHHIEIHKKEREQEGKRFQRPSQVQDQLNLFNNNNIIN